MDDRSEETNSPPPNSHIPDDAETATRAGLPEIEPIQFSYSSMIGQKIGDCTIKRVIGSGGMGTVYRATDTKLNRDVALKILPQQFASDSQRMSRVQRKAEVLAATRQRRWDRLGPGVQRQLKGLEEVGFHPLRGLLSLGKCW